VAVDPFVGLDPNQVGAMGGDTIRAADALTQVAGQIDGVIGAGAPRADGADGAGGSVTLRPRPAREVWRRVMHAVVSADMCRRGYRPGARAAQRG
jgi:hypothetical protein